MAVTTATRPIGSPVLSWEKAQQPVKPFNKKNNPLFIVAMVAITLLAIGGLWRIAHRTSSGQSFKVMAARTNIPAGSRLSITMVSFLDVPKQYASKGMITSLNAVSGRIAKTYIPAGEPITTAMLFAGRDGLSANLETQERAITLQLDDDALVDHSIMPDDRVDLLVVTSKNNKKYTKTICQDMRVLMSAPKEQVLARGANNSTNKITLAATAEDAEVITEAVEVGKIRLVLRSRLSRMEQHLNGIDPDDLLPAVALEDALPTIAAPSVPAPPPAVPDTATGTNAGGGPLQWLVEVISGNHKETYAVPEK